MDNEAKQRKWQEILNMANISCHDSIKYGMIEKVRVRDNDLSNIEWHIDLTFNTIVSWENLENTMSQLNDYLLSNYEHIKKVFYHISPYPVEKYEYDKIKRYYETGIDICSRSKNTISMLAKYKVDVEKETLLIKVASIADKNNVNSSLPTIKRYLKNYGFDNVSIDVEINEKEVNLRDVVLTQHRLVEARKEAELVEEYNMRKEKAKENTESSEYKPVYNKNTYITIKFNEIPTSSLEIETFKQTRGTNKVTLEGVVVIGDHREIKTNSNKTYNLYTGVITDYTDSITIKRFYKELDRYIFEKDISVGKKILVEGNIQWDNFANDVVIMVDRAIVYNDDTSRNRFDGAKDKRVELHAHTKMSVLDSILDVSEYVSAAKRYGHKALAVTDHANCHILPEFFKECKANGLKPIAGIEGYYIDDSDMKITLTNDLLNLNDATYVIFDIETTGFYIPFHEIIEIGAVKVKNGLILDNFSEFVKPKQPISAFISSLTDIKNETVASADSIEPVLKRFKEFIDGCVLVAHNATFDTDFIYANMKKFNLFTNPYPCIDTLQLARCLYGEGLKRFRLDAVAKYLKVEVEQQHRAIHDARTTSNVFLRMLADLYNHDIRNYEDINSLINKEELVKMVIPNHICLLVKNKLGLKNFYKIVSDANTTHFQKDARMLRSVIEQYREGILIGSGCVNGEVFLTAIEKTYDELLKKIDFYDYIEVQPPVCYLHLFEKTEETDALIKIKEIIRRIIKAAKEKNKIVVATGDVHELIKEDAPYRQIYLSVARPNGGGPHPLADYSPIDMHFRSTTEMLDEFSFLPVDVAYDIVVTNTNIISEQIEEYDIFPKKLFVPRDDYLLKYGVPSMKQAVHDISFNSLKSIYGDNPPLYPVERLQIELDKIIGNGYSSVYYISHLLVKNSNDAGYIVGSRGSVGSSFAATMMLITEVNPLKTHYRCPKCKFSAFKLTPAEQEQYNMHNTPELDEILSKAEVGFDLPPHKCPVCGADLIGDGVDIAFETFLGFEGEKVPDIDLNFSGDYQANAHLFVQEMFGIDGAFRAGTISTVMDKTAFAYVRDYYKKTGVSIRHTEIERIANFIAGAKKTTGQHPGGIVVVPDDIEYTDIIPVQYPPVGDPDEVTGLKWRTSHFDYHSFESNLLKLDILGHDDPTVIKTLMDYVHNEPNEFPFSKVEDIPFTDKDVLSLFSSKEVLHLLSSDGDTLSSGTIGIPEFGTSFVRGMLETIKPKTFADIIKVSGLSHGTDVWMKNAEDLFLGNSPIYPKVEFSEVIGCRDDIMLYLMSKDIPAHDAFVIMETVRKKGKVLKTSQEEQMRAHGVPDWYIYSCNKIQYLFPKAHATAYVIMALRIGWFKVHRPIYYYATYFSKRAKELDTEIFAMGKNAIRNKINDIDLRTKKKEEVSKKEKDLYNELKIALEMTLRGFTFRQIDLNKSLATNFVIAEDKKSLYLPFISVESLGDAVANSIIEARNKAPFTSKRDFEMRTSVNKTIYARLKTYGVLDDLPDNDTLI